MLYHTSASWPKGQIAPCPIPGGKPLSLSWWQGLAGNLSSNGLMKMWFTVCIHSYHSLLLLLSIYFKWYFMVESTSSWADVYQIPIVVSSLDNRSMCNFCFLLFICEVFWVFLWTHMIFALREKLLNKNHYKLSVFHKNQIYASLETKNLNYLF
jgi:hypothetical protein